MGWPGKALEKILNVWEGAVGLHFYYIKQIRILSKLLELSYVIFPYEVCLRGDTLPNR